MMGRKADAGRPMLYGTSQQFLEHFGLRDLGDLPTLREINELIGITDKGADAAPAESAPVSTDSEESSGSQAADIEHGADETEAIDNTPPAESAAPAEPFGGDERRSSDAAESEAGGPPPAQ